MLNFNERLDSFSAFLNFPLQTLRLLLGAHNPQRATPTVCAYVTAFSTTNLSFIFRYIVEHFPRENGSSAVSVSAFEETKKENWLSLKVQKHIFRFVLRFCLLVLGIYEILKLNWSMWHEYMEVARSGVMGFCHYLEDHTGHCLALVVISWLSYCGLVFKMITNFISVCFAML